MIDTLKLLVLSGIWVLAFGACDDCAEPFLDIDECINASVELSQDYESYVAFKQNKSKWECLNYSHYSYEFSPQLQVCFNQRIYIEIQDKQIVDTIILDAGVQEFCDSNFMFWQTIDEIFYRIEEAVDTSIQFSEPFYQEGKAFVLADRVNITYDSLTGLPNYGLIDYHIGIADEEYSWKILNFSGVR